MVIKITITGHIGDLDHDQITKKSSDLGQDQDLLKASTFECIEINLNVLHTVRL